MHSHSISSHVRIKFIANYKEKNIIIYYFVYLFAIYGTMCGIIIVRNLLSELSVNLLCRGQVLGPVDLLRELAHSPSVTATHPLPEKAEMINSTGFLAVASLHEV